MEHSNNNINNPPTRQPIDLTSLLRAHAKILAQLTSTTTPNPLTSAPPPSYAATMGRTATATATATTPPVQIPHHHPIHTTYPAYPAQPNQPNQPIFHHPAPGPPQNTYNPNAAPTNTTAPDADADSDPDPDSDPDSASEASDFSPPSDCDSNYAPNNTADTSAEDAGNVDGNRDRDGDEADRQGRAAEHNQLSITATTLVQGSRNSVAVAPVDGVRIAAMLAAVLDRRERECDAKCCHRQRDEAQPQTQHAASGTGPAAVSLLLHHPRAHARAHAQARLQHRANTADGNGRAKWHVTLDLGVKVVGDDNLVGATGRVPGAVALKRKAGPAGWGERGESEERGEEGGVGVREAMEAGERFGRVKRRCGSEAFGLGLGVAAGACGGEDAGVGAREVVV